ncbi:uncharacterized protein LOC117394429 [Acipenser ruthenus]|uniref:uncharacterized protein LOC117394429 n=1 Tax=Acipenser ruthenus TaxID=7906 RepID=UPI00274169CB|nr:uncharacterized protein LOC117394429 [Acipenser ruthenus]
MLPYALPDLSVLYNASLSFTRPLCALQCFPVLYQTSLCFTILPYALPCIHCALLHFALHLLQYTFIRVANGQLVRFKELFLQARTALQRTVDVQPPNMQPFPPQLSQKYGSVFTVWLGPKPVVILSGYETIRDALVNQAEEFSGRASYPMLLRVTGGYGVLVSSGERWKQLRRFSITTLKNFGMGRRSTEERIQEEAKSVVEAFAEKGGALFNPKFILCNAVSNVICSIVFGKRFQYNDEQFQHLLLAVESYFIVINSTTGMLYNMFPNVVKHLPGTHNKMFEEIENLKDFVKEQAQSREKDLDPDCPGDFIEAFMIKMQQEKDNPETEFHYENLVATVFNLFSAGTETTASTLRQALLIMIKYPHIQEKIHREIDAVIGSERSPSAQDRQHMPYTDAVIHEVQRLMDLAPTAVPHKVIKDTEFKGYSIPEGTMVLPLLSSVLSDPRLWKTPDKFNPEHFLDEDGGFKKNDAFLVFSLGKRVCLGEGLARMELFLFFTSLLQKFRFTGTQPPEEIDVSPALSSFGKLPKAYEFYAHRRLSSPVEESNLKLLSNNIRGTTLLHLLICVTLSPKATFVQQVLADLGFMDLVFLLESNALSVLLGLVVLLVLVLMSRGSSGKTSRLPPGPSPWPVLGNLLQVDLKKPYKSYLELSQKYGSVFTVWLGPKPVVILSGYETIRDALVNQAEEFSGRASYPMLLRVTGGYGVLVSSGERWKQLRRFSITTLKNFGMGRRSTEERIQEEAKSVVEAFAEKGGALFNPKFILYNAVSNVICSIVFGKRFQYNDEQFQHLLLTIDSYFKVLSSSTGMLYNMFPNVVKHLPGTHNKMFEEIENLKAFVKEQAQSREKDLDPDCPGDFIEAFMIKMQQEKDNPETEFHYENLVATVFNLFSAGTETTASTLRQALLIMIKYPHIQEKIHREIDAVIGSERSPSAQDRQHMPYTDAVIHEIQRSMDLTPTAVPHKVIKDTEFKGYSIPEGTMVLPLLSSVLSDPRLWKTPDKFNPEHFLDEDGGFKKNDAFLVFSLGKRVCLGEGLARMEIFLFFTSLLQKFRFTGTQPPEEIDVSPALSSFGKLPKAYKFYAHRRC